MTSQLAKMLRSFKPMSLACTEENQLETAYNFLMAWFLKWKKGIATPKFKGPFRVAHIGIATKMVDFEN